MSEPARIARGAATAAWLALAGSVALWPISGAGIGTLTTLLAGLPLALPLPGLLRGTRPALRAAPMALAPALALAVTEFLVNPPSRPFTGATLALILAAFAAILAALRTAAAGMSQAAPRASQSRTNGTVSRRCAASDSVSSASSMRHSVAKSRGARRVRKASVSSGNSRPRRSARRRERVGLRGFRERLEAVHLGGGQARCQVRQADVRRRRAARGGDREAPALFRQAVIERE